MGMPVAFDRTGGAALGRTPSYERGLPEIPRSTSFADEFGINAGSPPADPFLNPDAPASASRQMLDDTHRKRKIVRKPVAPSASAGYNTWDRPGTFTPTISAGHTEDRGSLGSNYSATSTTSNKGSGFTLGNLVKERVAGRCKMSHNQQQPPQALLDSSSEDETPVVKLSPAGLNSIDDWLDSREPFHKRTSTTSTRPSEKNLRLHIRQSTFAPLQPPEDSSPDGEETPVMPLIPARFLSKPAPEPRPRPRPLPTRSSSLTPQPNMQQEEPSSRQSSRPPSPPKTPEKPAEPEQPRGYIEQLEYEQSQIEARKTELRSEIWRIEQTVKNASTERPLRDRLNSRLEELNQDYADAEKAAHDLGLKLYRAYRRRDKRDGIEGPTHLWVSRVTAPTD